ncbi:hypothetical protein DMP17_11395 [Pseudonocardia sp. TMWB2A]|uniref:PspA/IM30 family protein n=1 Tax=Pseudonocardia sp. TMWB2A TaxID=687430 RepID=UPI00307EF025
MAEPIFNRMRRLIASKTEDTLDWLEASNPASILRGALRDMDKSIATLESARADEFGKRTAAERLEKEQNEQARKMGDNARFAYEKGREDLARAALAEQLGLEAGVKVQQALQHAARDKIALLDTHIAKVQAERAEMKIRLDRLEADRANDRAHQAAGAGAALPDKVAGTVHHARETFDRVTSLSGTGHRAPDVAATQQVDEIVGLQLDAELDARMAALGKAPAAKPSKARTSKA